METKKEDPRSFTTEEMRNVFLLKIKEIVLYWSTVKFGLSMTELIKQNGGEIKYRLDGLVHSILVMLDGGTDLPAFDLIPTPHPSDAESHRNNGENWWPPNTIINECQLHEMWHKM